MIQSEAKRVGDSDCLYPLKVDYIECSLEQNDRMHQCHVSIQVIPMLLIYHFGQKKLNTDVIISNQVQRVIQVVSSFPGVRSGSGEVKPGKLHGDTLEIGVGRHRAT